MIGIWLALVATFAMLAGVVIGRARISLVIELTEREPRPTRTGLGLGHLRRHRRATPPARPASETTSPPVGPVPERPGQPAPADEQPTRPQVQAESDGSGERSPGSEHP